MSSKMKIVTLTLNPAFDIHCGGDAFVPYSESVLEITSRDAGGKGVNISRALKSVGVSSAAIVVVGSENGDEFCKKLENDGLTVSPIFREGRIRENITIHEKANPETRISFGGFSVDESVLSEIRHIMGECDKNTVITLTGSIPPGVSTKSVLDMLLELKKDGARVVIDSRSVTLDEILEFKPWLIKPNRDEAEKYSNEKIESPRDASRIAEKLHDAGVENVMISLGGDGAVLSYSEGCFFAKATEIEAVSTVGAGDSMIAGFIGGYTEGLSAPELLLRAVSFGTAACMREGTDPPKRSDIIEIQKTTKIIAI